MNENIPEFHGNPNDLVFNPDYVFKLREEIEQLKADKQELANTLIGWIDNYESQYGESEYSAEQKEFAQKHKEKTE